MLVLSRKSNESIVIGDQIVVEILEISNNKIRIGIAAPASVRVVRGELTPKEPSVGRTPTSTPANASTEHGREDGTGRGRMMGRPLGRMRNNEPRRSANPHVRTVADAARVRLRQLRQQLIQEGSSRDVRASQLTPPETSLLDPPGRDENPGCKLSGQEVAEPTPNYQVATTRPRLERRFEPNSRAEIMEDRLTASEVYWHVKSLNQYQSDWVAEEPTWYEAIDAVPSVLVR